MDEIVKEIEVVKSYGDIDWYAKCIGQKFSVIDPAWWSTAEDDCYYVDHPENDEDTVFYVLKKDCKVIKSVAQSAPETTASPSETAAVEGILTEGELKEYERLNIDLVLSFQEIKKLIISHRELFKVNAELSFKNMKHKRLVEAVLKAHRERGAIMTEACGDGEAVTIAYDLEELKHE